MEFTSHDSGAFIELGNKYLSGDGVEKNMDAAYFFYKKAAELNNPAAMYQIGGMNFYCLISNPSLKEATYWFCKAAQYGNSESLYMAGKCCLLATEENMWDLGIELLKQSGDSRAIALLQYACRPFRNRSVPKMYKLTELYEILRCDEKNTKYVYRGQTECYPYPLRPSAYRSCYHSKFPMCGNSSGMRNWGNYFYLEHDNLNRSDNKWKRHAVKRIMSMYLNNALGYPLAQALLQQAGYSSEGLDVSYNIKIALFFALYDYNEHDGTYHRKMRDKPSVIYRWKVPEETFTLYDNYYCKAHLIPTLDIFQQFSACDCKSESIASMNRYLREIGWGTLNFDLPDRRPYELLKIPKEALQHSRIVVQQGALLIPDVIPGHQMQLQHEMWGYPIEKKSALATNLVHDLSDPTICDTFLIDCSDIQDSELNIFADLPSPNQIYHAEKEDITHILTNNIMEQAYQEILMMGCLPLETLPAMPGYGLSYIDALSLLLEWNKERKNSIYFFK